MNFKYCKFVFLDTIKRTSIWVTWLLYLITTMLLAIILPFAAGMNTFHLWANSTMPICQTFMGITAAIFTAILSINIFKNARDEGTELIIISKPITRRSATLCKFLVFFFFCLLVNITAVLLSLFTICLPNTEPKFYWGMVVSMFIGNLVTFGIFGAIAILLSIRFARVGIILGNVIISLVMLIYQILASFVLSSTMTSLTGIGSSNETVKVQSYVLPVRQEDGSFKEENYACFIPLLNKQGEYDIKATDWTGVKQYWDDKNSKDGHSAIIATDIGSQLALSYCCAGLNGFSDRQAQRMYNFSRYYNYDLNKPASPEYYESTSDLKFIYSNESSRFKLTDDYSMYLPWYFIFPGVRSTKSAFLKGTITDSIPVADINVNGGFLTHKDVFFDKDEWTKYSSLFNTMYSFIFKYDLKDGNGNNYYSYTDAELTKKSKSFALNEMWCDSTDNLNKWYKLVWACFTGHHSDNAYLGNSDNNPLKGKTAADFGVESVLDLNKRYCQFKDYCYYKTYDLQHELMFNGVNNTQWAKEEASYTAAKAALQAIYDADKTLNLVQTGSGIGNHGFVLRANTNSSSIIIQPGTQTINNTLLVYTANNLAKEFTDAGLTPTDTEWLDSAVNGSYATWVKTASIADQCYMDEEYLFESLEEPDRTDSIVSEQFITREVWIPYYYNLGALEMEDPYPFGQNLQYIFYECSPRIQYWEFALIWGLISLCLYGAGAIVYNKYDIK